MPIIKTAVAISAAADLALGLFIAYGTAASWRDSSRRERAAAASIAALFLLKAAAQVAAAVA